jgi:hypothetical protein
MRGAMRSWMVAAGIALAGCGRVGFDGLGGVGGASDANGGDGTGSNGSNDSGSSGGNNLVQVAGGTAHAKTLTVTLPGALTAGGFVAVAFTCATCDAAVTPLVTDNGGDTLAQAITIENTQVLLRSTIFFAANTSAASSVTVDYSAMTAIPYLRMVVAELSGLPPAAMVYGTKASASTNYPTLSSGSMPVTAGDLLVGVVQWENCGGNTISATAGFTLIVPPACDTDTAIAAEYQIVGTSGSMAARFTDSTDDWYAAVGAAFH